MPKNSLEEIIELTKVKSDKTRSGYEVTFDPNVLAALIREEMKALLPEKKSAEPEDDSDNRGWNDCLDEINKRLEGK